MAKFIIISKQKATAAVYISDESEMVSGNVLGIVKPIDGYGHEDCIIFSGVCEEREPQYKSEKKIDDLIGKTPVFELRFAKSTAQIQIIGEDSK